MSCKCCAGPCRKKRVKRKTGAKKPKAQKQPQVSITLVPPMLSKMPKLAPTFQSSVFTPLEEQRFTPRTRTIETQTEASLTLPSGRQTLMTEFARTTRPAGRPSASEREAASLRGLSVPQYRTALERGTLSEE